MATPGDPPPYIEIQGREEDGGIIRFFSRAEAVSWIDDEWENWKWFRQAGEGEYHRAQVILNKLEQARDRCRANDHGATQALLREFVQDGLWPLSRSARGATILRLKEVNVALAYDAVLYATQSHPSFSNIRPQLLRAGVILEVAKASEAATVQSEIDSLEAVRKEWTKATALMSAEIQRLIHHGKEKADNLESLHSSHEKRFEQQKEKIGADLAEIRSDYETRIKFLAPLNYWKTRSDRHSKTAKKWGEAAVGLLVLSVIVLACVTWGSQSPASIVENLQDKAVAVGVPLGEKVIATALTQAWIGFVTSKVLWILIFLWPLRILVRNYLSNLHLSLDAEERTIVLETFLAMNTHGDLTDEDVRKTALSEALKVIFRHTQDGVVKDDALPQAELLGWISKPGR